MDEIDALMVGPHLAYILDEVEGVHRGQRCEGDSDEAGLLFHAGRRQGLDHLIAEME